ncbi:MAG: GlxA family transcriptional regulator [Amphritea sp.]
MDSSLSLPQHSSHTASTAQQAQPDSTFLKPDDDGVFTLSFLLLPEYAMLSLLSAIEPLRVANRLAGKELYRWQCLSEDGNAVFASNEMALQPHRNIHEIELPRNLFVNSSFHPERYVNPTTIEWLRKLHRQGCILGALDTGCYLLAKAKLLKGHRITMHWEAVPVFQEENPTLKISHELFEIDDKRITCAGGTAATDLVLHLIQLHSGVNLALQVCEQFIKTGIRQKSDKQRISLAHRLNIHHPRLLKVLGLMDQHIDTPMTPLELAESAFISLRQLERLFNRFLDCTPSQYYLKLRLNRARQLLCESELNVCKVATASGFSSAPHFCRTYRSHFGMTPKAQRKASAPLNSDPGIVALSDRQAM